MYYRLIPSRHPSFLLLSFTVSHTAHTHTLKHDEDHQSHVYLVIILVSFIYSPHEGSASDSCDHSVCLSFRLLCLSVCSPSLYALLALLALLALYICLFSLCVVRFVLGPGGSRLLLLLAIAVLPPFVTLTSSFSFSQLYRIPAHTHTRTPSSTFQTAGPSWYW